MLEPWPWSKSTAVKHTSWSKHPKALRSYTHTHAHASVKILGMWVGNPKSFTQNNWDYFDAKAALHPATRAESFGGVSGGALRNSGICPQLWAATSFAELEFSDVRRAIS